MKPYPPRLTFDSEAITLLFFLVTQQFNTFFSNPKSDKGMLTQLRLLASQLACLLDLEGRAVQIDLVCRCRYCGVILALQEPRAHICSPTAPESTYNEIVIPPDV
jgi:hypothetical protein